MSAQNRWRVVARMVEEYLGKCRPFYQAWGLWIARAQLHELEE